MSGYREKFRSFTEQRIRHWNRVAGQHFRSRATLYQKVVEKRYQSFISPGLDVLEIGCGCGHLISAVKPRRGVGIDFSGAMIDRAKNNYPEYSFHEADAHDFELEGNFDVIIVSDLLDDLWSVGEVLRRIKLHSTDHTRVFVNSTSRFWQPLVHIGRKLGIITPVLRQNWLAPGDIENLARLAGFALVTHRREILLPVLIPGLETLCNRFLARLPLLDHLCFSNFFIMRSELNQQQIDKRAQMSVSIVVAARNEAGNIEELVSRTPRLAEDTEIIFVVGGSSDGTYETIENRIASKTDVSIKLFKQPGLGKGDAVRKGFEEASGDILVILDADMTVAPEDLSLFVEALKQGRGEFINGVRLVYPRESQSMRYVNLLANKAFGMLFSWLIGQRIKDTLCGTKVLLRTDYKKIANNRWIFGDSDPFGDFDLILGASRQNLQIIDLPVRYFDRTYGVTNIKRWSAGILLSRMSVVAALKLKFR